MLEDDNDQGKKLFSDDDILDIEEQQDMNVFDDI